jgi:hypothetical protein
MTETEITEKRKLSSRAWSKDSSRKDLYGAIPLALGWIPAFAGLTL